MAGRAVPTTPTTEPPQRPSRLRRGNPSAQRDRAQAPAGAGFAHCPDIVLNSTYWAETDEVAAFEELVGSHGGMGGEQSHPLALFPIPRRQRHLKRLMHHLLTSPAAGKFAAFAS